MNKITFYDTETTGLPEWKIPSGDEKQPHLVSLTAIQCNADTEEIIQRVDLIVKSDGWESQPKAFEAHGITKEHSIEVGVPEMSAINMLLFLTFNGIRVAHNKTFDQRIIRIGLKRYNYPELDFERWLEKENHKCTMQMAKPIMQLLPKNNWGYKNPNLTEAYKYFTGKELVNAHSSSADTEACMKIYFAMTREKPAETKPVDPPGPVNDPCPNCDEDWGPGGVCQHCGFDIPF